MTFAGTLVQDCAITGCPGGGPTAGPWPAAGTAGTFISAHTINNNAAIYTAPGTNPAYVSTEVTLMGTGECGEWGGLEAVARTRFEGMTTDADPTAVAQRLIHLYGIDFNPLTGATTDRDLAPSASIRVRKMGWARSRVGGASVRRVCHSAQIPQNRPRTV